MFQRQGMIVKSASYLVLLMSLYVGGCTTSAYVSKTLDDANLGLPIKSVKAGGVWGTGEPGHGLQIYVWAESDGSRYQRNLDLELDGAAKVCAALAEGYRVLEWAYIDVYYFNTYQRMLNAPHRVVGVAEVIIRRETLAMLREQKAPASEYPRHWRFIAGHKDQPDSKAILSW
jgi:hypothetical protein